MNFKEIDHKQLFRKFCDEDTETWIEAAREMGRRAANEDDDCIKIIETYTKTGLDEGDEDFNEHRFRHAHCALVSFVSDGGDQSLFQDTIYRVKGIFSTFAQADLVKDDGATVADLMNLPDKGNWLDEKRKELEGRLSEMRQKNVQQAIEAIEQEQEQLRPEPNQISLVKLDYKPDKLSPIKVSREDKNEKPMRSHG